MCGLHIEVGLVTPVSVSQHNAEPEAVDLLMEVLLAVFLVYPFFHSSTYI